MVKVRTRIATAMSWMGCIRCGGWAMKRSAKDAVHMRIGEFELLSTTTLSGLDWSMPTKKGD